MNPASTIADMVAGPQGLLNRRERSVFDGQLPDGSIPERMDSFMPRVSKGNPRAAELYKKKGRMRRERKMGGAPDAREEAIDELVGLLARRGV